MCKHRHNCTCFSLVCRTHVEHFMLFFFRKKINFYLAQWGCRTSTTCCHISVKVTSAPRCVRKSSPAGNTKETAMFLGRECCNLFLSLRERLCKLIAVKLRHGAQMLAVTWRPLSSRGAPAANCRISREQRCRDRGRPVARVRQRVMKRPRGRLEGDG